MQENKKLLYSSGLHLGVLLSTAWLMWNELTHLALESYSAASPIVYLESSLSLWIIA